MAASLTIENIIKQGYLKKGNTGGNRLSGLLKKIEGQKWFVFTIRQGVPYLEYFDNDTDVFSQRPVNSYCLSRCRNVTSSMGRTNPPSFSIVCADRFIELVASSRPQMLEWVHDIENTLTRLGILKKEKDEHVYSPLPAVIRQPRFSVSQIDNEERGAQAMSSNGTNPSSGEISDQGQAQAPPLPQRPPRVSMRNKQPDPSSSTVPKTDFGSELEMGACALNPSVGLGATAAVSDSTENIHCSNDSDFVSWEMVMRVRENFLNKNEACEDMEEGGDCAQGAMASSPQENVELVSDKPASYLYAKPRPRKKFVSLEDSLDLTVLPDNSASSFSNLESDSDQIHRQSQVEENEYSLLPGAMQDGKAIEVDDDAEIKTKMKPVPMPRRALSLKESSWDNVDLTDPNDQMRYKDSTLFPLDQDMKISEEPSPLLPSDSTGDLLGITFDNIVNDENITPLGTLSDNKDENANFYDDKNSTPHCFVAPPSIPPRCDSLAGWTPPIPPLPPTTDLDQDFTTTVTANPNVYTHSISSSTPQFISPPTLSHSCKESSIPLESPPPPPPSLSSSSPFDFAFPHKENAGSITSPPPQQPPQIPPLPLQRRKTTKPGYIQSDSYIPDSQTHAVNTDIPPRLPTRRLPKSISLPDEPPPQFPARNSRSVAVMRPKLTSSFSFAESDEKAKLLDDQTSIASAASIRERDRKSATMAATPVSRQSGLARKMLLDRANSMHTVVSLKQTQAEILQAEIDKSHVSVTLTQKSGHGLALVDWNGMPCVAGWNQKDFPSLHGKLHIGDMLISVNHVRVASSDMAQKLLRHATDPKIEVVLQRMPNARIFAIRRAAEGQSLGFKREGGTAEILYVDPNGLAAEFGLPQYAPGTMGKARCTWFLTEINSRPLSLFFKENEIEHLLYAVGREISIVVQPSDFILEIRKALKKLKNYKTFITH